MKTEEETGVASTSQGMPKMASNHQMETKKYSSLEPSEGARPCRHRTFFHWSNFLKSLWQDHTALITIALVIKS